MPRDEKKAYYLNLMSIPQYHDKQKINTSVSPPVQAVANMDWTALQNAVKTCQACPLHKTRTQTVFGVGNIHSPVLFVGEAPGFYEDQKGEPFVGRAGQLLDAMLKAIDCSRETIYIANILKCRPPNNRDPNAEEVATCTPFLKRQIALIKPQLIVALGRIAAHYLLQTNTPMHQLRGKFFTYEEIPLLVTYHPAYLLRSPQDKAKAWQDLIEIKKLIPTASLSQ